MLARVRVAGPSAGLRSRILSSVRESRAWPWAAAAAALLVLTLTLRAGAGAQLGSAYAPPVDANGAAVEELTSLLGGTAEARAIAEAASLQERLREARAALPSTVESR